ncbi:helix-turn-helix domain-containing protein [Arthrobacter sp. lap29]|uniref:helix-turn-helix domain-containing protein n=1 Tax=Arthrobacter sp. lap29 TaxID=3056122 RepID=UPI0028F706F4|nr:helix-turn-helix domain-containing protein [Arthrobacter sp. lap29]
MSTQLSLVNGGKSEPLSSKVARRLRGQLAELRISGSSLARITGLTQSKVSRRLNGDAPLELDELQMIEEATGISVAYLLGFSDVSRTGGPGPDGGVPAGGSANPRASD